jgi:hypothetical protein
MPQRSSSPSVVGNVFSNRTTVRLSPNQPWKWQRMQQAESAQTLGGKLARRLESRMTIQGGVNFSGICICEVAERNAGGLRNVNRAA